jgi:hypothetical protein
MMGLWDRQSSRQSFRGGCPLVPSPVWYGTWGLPPLVLRTRDNDSRHTVRFQEVVQVLFDNASAAARCMADENSVMVADNDAAMEHIKVLACGCKEDQIACF